MATIGLGTSPPGMDQDSLEHQRAIAMQRPMPGLGIQMAAGGVRIIEEPRARLASPSDINERKAR